MEESPKEEEEEEKDGLEVGGGGGAECTNMTCMDGWKFKKLDEPAKR